jgi:hypothetical protein
MFRSLAPRFSYEENHAPLIPLYPISEYDWPLILPHNCNLAIAQMSQDSNQIVPFQPLVGGNVDFFFESRVYAGSQAITGIPTFSTGIGSDIITNADGLLPECIHNNVIFPNLDESFESQSLGSTTVFRQETGIWNLEQDNGVQLPTSNTMR